jgi:hypothetical protein
VTPFAAAAMAQMIVVIAIILGAAIIVNANAIVGAFQ